MQVILTEDEYLTLKNKHEEQKKTFVKRIDVAMSIQDLVKDLLGNARRYDPITFQPSEESWRSAIERFWERIDSK